MEAQELSGLGKWPVIPYACTVTGLGQETGTGGGTERLEVNLGRWTETR